MNEQAKNVPEVTIAHCKQVDAVVHSDGNIFFTSIDKLNKAVALAASQPPIEADTTHGGLEHQPDGSVHFEEYPTPATETDKVREASHDNQ
jgi:hypothetical protein